MTSLSFILLAFIAGTAIAAQASMNAQLGVLLQNTLLASLVAFFSGFVFTLISFISMQKNLPDYQTVSKVPVYLWFTGGLLSAFAISSFYWLIPRMGVAGMISAALAGQLCLAMIAGHYGWFNLPVTPLTPYKLLGAISLVMGIVLINQA